MICGALQTLNEDAYEDVAISERASPSGLPTGEMLAQHLAPIRESSEFGSPSDEGGNHHYHHSILNNSNTSGNNDHHPYNKQMSNDLLVHSPSAPQNNMIQLADEPLPTVIVMPSGDHINLDDTRL